MLRRTAILSGLAAIAAAATKPAAAASDDVGIFSWFGRGFPGVEPSAREVVSFPGNYGTGLILISTSQRALYLTLGGGQAIRYSIGVGRAGFTWSGNSVITRKAEWPSWTPPAQMRRRRPDLPYFMRGGIENPMGARAMYLGSSLYRIHGSNEPETIGTPASSGCFRLHNADVIDLYNRVRVGTRVVVLR